MWLRGVPRSLLDVETVECLARPPTFYIIQTRLEKIKHRVTCQRGVAQSFAEFHGAARWCHAFLFPRALLDDWESPIRPSGSVVVVEGERVDEVSPKFARVDSLMYKESQTGNVGNGLGS